jgi:hypothetical protein
MRIIGWVVLSGVVFLAWFLIGFFLAVAATR